MGTHYNKTSNVDIYKKAELFGMPCRAVDGNNFEGVYSIVNELISKVREKSKPAMVECRTYRWMSHSAFDNRPYRLKEEIEKWKKQDPIELLENN